jgi:predicted RNA-binding Zn-ribbon protein involved in translation (DUF1610 family)
VSIIKGFYIDIFGTYSPMMFFWTIIALGVVVLAALYFIMRDTDKRPRELALYNVTWRWEWKGEQILGLWCYCPVCGEKLICDDEYSRSRHLLASKTTYFICGKCGEIERTRVIGGDRTYVLRIVRREIMKQFGRRK